MNWNWMAAGGIGAVAASAFSQVRNFISQIAKIVVCVKRYSVSEEVAVSYLLSKKTLTWGDWIYATKGTNTSKGFHFGLYKMKFNGRTILAFLPWPCFVKMADWDIRITHL